MKGVIALDVDGTLTNDMYSLPKEVETYLNSISKDWRLIIVTGRSFYFAKKALTNLQFPFLFLVQNGSLVVKMPKEELYLKTYMSKEVVASVEQAMNEIKGMMLVYAGYEHRDVCFWKKGIAPPIYQDYLKSLSSKQGQLCKECTQFEIDEVPMVKCIGPRDEMVLLAEKLKLNELIETSLIKDPFSAEFYLLLITKKGVSKGKVLKYILEKEGRGEVVIAAGNDDNDLSMFEVADIKIAMSTSPAHMLKKADFIAPPVEGCGIISALEQVIQKY